MCAWIAIVAAGRVDVGDMALAQSCHLNDVAWVAAQCPTCLGVHDVLKLFAGGLVGDIVGQHYQLYIL